MLILMELMDVEGSAERLNLISKVAKLLNVIQVVILEKMVGIIYTAKENSNISKMIQLKMECGTCKDL